MAASLEIAILLYQGVTALDAVGPWEVLSRLPGAKVRFVGKEVGPVVAEGGRLLLGATHSIAETTAPDVVVVPGGSTTPGQMVDDEVLEWLRKVHRRARWTASVCTGALILGAAGILKGQPATTHWYKMGVLRTMGAKPRPDERVVRSGKVVTAAGVSAGIDLALWLAGEIAGAEQAEAIQLVIEYDPRPPFDAGHMSKASKEVQRLAKKMMDDSIPADQRRLVPTIAWNRFIDLIRTGR
ncbi:transcriptional regulator GlxA family with amidase domain [Bradyrhizobium sp. LB8.2]|uniref:DJ-1/PfpI family protein n=2 Tax=Bradyrhizobium TaxID=374 RepID=UPI001FFB4001|nr:DJ-1/PfpI family protein [Bradyrhizobium sp. 132]MCK1776855.1 DJ-1/PfpI family protein [Bradyrhizobium sp. 132]